MKKLISYSFITLFCLTLSIPSFTQGGLVGGGGGGGNRIDGKYKIMPIPYVNYSRSIGFSIGALPMVMFNPVAKDTISPSSLVGGLGMWATNGTWFGMGFGSFHFAEDKWRVQTAGGLGAVNYQFYVSAVDIWVPYTTDMDFYFVQLQRKIYKGLYGGMNYVYLKFKTQINEWEKAERTIFRRGIGFSLAYDQRSNIYYPRKGFQTNLKYNTYPEWMGNGKGSDKIEFDYNHYFPSRKNTDVIAARFFAGLGLGALSFNQQFIVGQTDIRGYTQGEYRGNYLLTIQGEYRWNFHKKWGAVGFAGVATIFESLNPDQDGKLLPGIGTGIRFTASEETQFKVGIDVAAGEGDWGIYFRISEAF